MGVLAPRLISSQLTRSSTKSIFSVIPCKKIQMGMKMKMKTRRTPKLLLIKITLVKSSRMVKVTSQLVNKMAKKLLKKMESVM